MVGRPVVVGIDGGGTKTIAVALDVESGCGPVNRSACVGLGVEKWPLSQQKWWLRSARPQGDCGEKLDRVVKPEQASGSGTLCVPLLGPCASAAFVSSVTTDDGDTERFPNPAATASAPTARWRRSAMQS